MPLNRFTDSRLQHFSYIKSTPDAYLLTDKHNNLLAYRFRLPDSDTILKQLHHSAEEVFDFIPEVNAVGAGLRGGFQSTHLGVWSDYATTPRLTKEHASSLPHSTAFIQLNQRLWQIVSSTLRCISPETYASLIGLPLPSNTNITTDDYPAPYRSVCINRNQQNSVAESTVHQDWQDHVLNTVIPFGTYKGAELVLWSCGRVLELLPGDILIFDGSKIAHQVAEITSGTRHSVDLFTHKSDFSSASRQRLLDGKIRHKRFGRFGYQQIHPSDHSRLKPTHSQPQKLRTKSTKKENIVKAKRVSKVKAPSSTIITSKWKAPRI